MAAQPTPRRRFQFRLRTLFVVITVVAVILGTQALMVRPIAEFTYGGNRIIYDDASWWIAPLVIDGGVIGLAIWFVRRKPPATNS